MWTCARCGKRNESDLCACGSDASTCETCGAPAKAGRCEACRRAIEDRPSGRLTRVHNCTNPAEAELLRVELRRAGIPSILENEGGASFAVGLGTVVVPYAITVAEHDVAHAHEILRGWLERHPSEVYVPPVAMIKFPCACGRTLEVPPDFRGLEMDCPFCGRPVTAGKSPTA